MGTLLRSTHIGTTQCRLLPNKGSFGSGAIPDLIRCRGQTAQFAAGVLGYEWDEVIDNGFLPGGLIQMSSTTIGVENYCQDYGSTFAPGVGTHHLTLYRHSSGALVFSAGGPDGPGDWMQRTTLPALLPIIE